MPFRIVRNDLTHMQADAIVNAANPRPIVGYGVDSAVHKAAGPELLLARRKIGDIAFGDAAITPAYHLPARYVIHTASPIWQGGLMGEEKLLQSCYEKSLQLAWEAQCTSIAFPLLSAGNHGFPKDRALQIAISVFSRFLMDHDMQIDLVVFGSKAVELSEKLFASVQSYIDEHYIREKTLEEYGVPDKCAVRGIEIEQLKNAMYARRQAAMEDAMSIPLPVACAPAPAQWDALSDFETEETFSEALIRMIDERGLKDPQVYKKANIDRKLFSKIRNNPDYQPSKITALAFAIALELTEEETRDFIARAGFALTRSSKFDVIIEYFIRSGNYDIFEINETLFRFEQPLIGA